MSSQKYVLTAIGPDQPGIVASLSGFLAEHGCNLEDSRMATLGGEFAVILLVSKAQSGAPDLSSLVPELEQLTGMSVHARPTSVVTTKPGVPFVVRGYAMDHPGIVHAITREVASIGANIDELETTMRPAPITGAPLFDVRLRIALPPEASVQDFKRKMLEVSDQHNMDILVEPYSG